MAGDDLAALLRQGEELRWQRRYDEAAAVFAEVVRQAESSRQEDCLADALVWLSIVRSLATPSEDGLQEALQLQERALSLDAAKHGEAHPRVAETLRNIGRTLTSMGRQPEAIQRLTRAAEIFRATSTCSTSAEDTLAQLVGLLAEQADYTSSVETATELVALCTQLGDDMRLTMAHFHLGRALVMVGRGSDAIVELERVLQLAGPRIAKGNAQRLVSEVNDWLARARTGT